MAKFGIWQLRKTQQTAPNFTPRTQLEAALRDIVVVLVVPFFVYSTSERQRLTWLLSVVWSG